MPSPEVDRLRQRLQSLGRAIARLEDACSRPRLNELERSGQVRVHGHAFELTWKTLKDLLSAEGITTTTPRQVLRESFAAGLLTEDEAEALLDALEKRNLLAHTYEEKLADEAERLIRESYTPVILQVYARLEARGEPR